MPQFLFDLPQISCLSRKGGAGDLPQSRKPIRVVSAKVREHVTFRVVPQKFSDYFYREHFTISQGGLRTALSQLSPGQKVFDQAEHSYHERGNIHLGDLSYLVFVSQLHKYGGLLLLSST